MPETKLPGVPPPRFDTLSARIKTEFPRFRIVNRNGTWLGLLFKIFGFFTRQNNADDYITTVFSTVYVPSTWWLNSPDERYKDLRHELQHIRQFHRWPLGRWAWPANHLLTALAYLFLLPVLWTMRAHFERQGYTQDMLVDFELGGRISDLKMEENAAELVEVFSTVGYFFMSTRRQTYAWAMDTQRRINNGEIRNDHDRVSLPIPPSESDTSSGHSTPESPTGGT